jgi:tetratricopeptide (TPR) repeat protein
MFERAVQLDPNFADAYAWLSLTLTEQFGAGLGDRKTLDDAIAQANKALEIDPQLIVARRALIQLYRYVSKTSEGLMQARLALATDPNDVDAIAAAAFAYFEAGMPDKSIPLYEKALNADPSNTDVRNRLARSYLYARAYQKGLDVLAPMLAQNQGGEWMAMQCYWSLKQYDKAIAMGDRLLKSDPKKTFPLVGGLDFGKLLKEVGQVERARAVWREGIASGEAQLAIIENVRTRVWVGHMYAALGERDKALEQLRRVLQLEPDSAWTLYQAGEISAFLGNKREAVDYFKQAIAHGWLEVQYFYDYPDELLGDDAEYREVRDGLQNKVDKLKAQY